jgi:hypothetical protein
LHNEKERYGGEAKANESTRKQAGLAETPGSNSTTVRNRRLLLRLRCPEQWPIDIANVVELVG